MQGILQPSLQFCFTSRLNMVSLFSEVLLILTTTLLLSLRATDGAKILSVAFMSTRSHKITYEPLLQALAARGHEVTIVSPVPAKKSVPNIREILTIDYDKLLEGAPNLFEAKEKGAPLDPFTFFKQLVNSCELSLDLPQVRALQAEKFDLIFVSSIMNECAMAFAHTFKTNIILISPISVPSASSSLFGNPSPPSFVPNVMTGYTDRMTFYERTINLLVESLFRVLYQFIYFPTIEATYRGKLGADHASVYEIYDTASLILSNSHFSIASIRPFLPDIIEVGGMHCHPARPLPKDLEDFVSSSGDDGFILFSMGSVLKTTDMQEEKRKMLLSVFAQLKQKVLWKWETEEMADLPPNVKLSRWLPQQDVLGHPKIRAFITHGGFGSTTEAVYHGVPLIGLPMFADQALNMEMAEKSGFGITLDFSTFTKESLLAALNKIVSDSTYKGNATAISNVFRDQPDHPLDRAVFWSEYVIRHKGAKHLRSAGRDLNFFQYHSIDVIGLIAATILLSLWLVWKILKLMFNLVCSFLCPKSKAKIEISKKKK